MSFTTSTNLRVTVPSWRAPASTCIQHYHLTDYGDNGIGLVNDGTSTVVGSLKVNSQACLGAKMCAMPFLPPDPRWVSVPKPCNKFDPNSLQWKRSVRSCRRYLTKTMGIEKELREILSKLSNGCNVVVDVPEFICRLANRIPNNLTPEGKSIDEFHLRSGGGGGMHYHALSDNDVRGLLFHCSGRSMETLVATEVDINDDGNRKTAAFPFLKPGLNTSACHTFPSKIHQITTQQLSQGIYCGVRQTSAISLGTVHFAENSDITVKITDVKASSYYITDLAFSPYIDGDYVYVRADGIFYFTNMEMGVNIDKHGLLLAPNSIRLPEWWTCEFASHPRCVVFGNENGALLRDLRDSSRRSLSLFTLKSFDLAYLGEKMCTVRRSLSNAYLHYISTSYSLFAFDERFPNHPFLTWKHQMQSSPVFCSLATYSRKQSESCEAVVLASHASKEVVLFNVHHQGTNKTESLCPPLHISSPSDFVDALLQNCYAVDPIIKLRTDTTLHGLDCISPNVDQLTVMQLTEAGDVFYQDFQVHQREDGIPTELGHKQGPGYTFGHLDDELARHAVAWTEEAVAPLINVPNFLSNANDVDVSRLVQSLPKFSDHTHGCPLCCRCAEHCDTPSDPKTICATCGISFQYGQLLTTTAEQNGILAGSVPGLEDAEQNVQINPPLDLFSTNDLNTKNDPLLRRLLDVWTKEEPPSDIDQAICQQILPEFDGQDSVAHSSCVSLSPARVCNEYVSPSTLITDIVEGDSQHSTGNVSVFSSVSLEETSTVSQTILASVETHTMSSYDSPYCVEAEEVVKPIGTYSTTPEVPKTGLRQSSVSSSRGVKGARVEGF